MTARPPRDTPPSRAPHGPFSRPLNVNDVKDEGLVITIEAEPGDMTAIAEAVKLPAVRRLVVRYKIQRRSGGRYEVSGELRATATQICVVTLDAFESDLHKDIDLDFVQPFRAADMPGLDRRFKDVSSGGKRPERGPAPMPGSDDQDDPADTIVDDTIDLGAIALEFLTLACDLYPRKPGVQFSDTYIGENVEPDPSAFAALGRLKDQS